MYKEHWEYIADLKQTGSIAATSRHYNVSPQSLGKTIRVLENEIGFQLLDRSPHGVTLTPAAEKALVSASNFFDDLERLRTLASPSGNVQCDFHTSHDFSHVGDIMSVFSMLFPKTNLSFKEHYIADIFKLLLEKEIDFATVSLLTHNDKPLLMHDDFYDWFTFYPFIQSHIAVFAPNSHPLARYKNISLKAALDYPIIAFVPDKNPDNSILSILPHLGYSKPKNYCTESIPEIYYGRLAQGYYIAISPEDASISTKISSKIKLIPLKDNIVSQTCYVLRKNDQLSNYPMIQAHLEYVHGSNIQLL